METGGMRRKRPCRICRKWFLPNARAGDRQEVCSRRECQRERHRRACADWHQRNPGYDREERLRRKLETEAEGNRLEVDPLAGVDWVAARDAVGLETAVLIKESGKVLVNWARDAVTRQAREIKGESPKVLPTGTRDAIARAGADP